MPAIINYCSGRSATVFLYPDLAQQEPLMLRLPAGRYWPMFRRHPVVVIGSPGSGPGPGVAGRLHCRRCHVFDHVVRQRRMSHDLWLNRLPPVIFTWVFWQAQR